jgi:hypothetical protein
MDGPSFFGQRKISTQFQHDRHSQERLELAYRRVESPPTTLQPAEASVQTSSPKPLQSTVLVPEIQG